MKRLLIANRGEIAIRIMKTAAEIGLQTIAVYPDDDSRSAHVDEADSSALLPGTGPAAYLSIHDVIAVARSTGADAIHPGYGFLSEEAEFARSCARADIVFVGPAPETLDLFGNKASARTHAQKCGVRTLPGIDHAVSIGEARALLRDLGEGGAVMLKAVAGGGGRGMRSVTHADELDDVFARCSAEAESLFGNGSLFIERLLPGARHVEVQVIGDGSGAAVHLGERECSLQRSRQKIVEWTPAENLPLQTRSALHEAAVRMAREASLRSLATIEFLVSPDGKEWAFIEANPRLQVEHTVTEELYDLDLVRLQIAIAQGAELAELSLPEDPKTNRTVLQARINLETMAETGAVPSHGVLDHYSPATGPGIRVDGYGRIGYRTSPRYDPLLAKLIVRVPGGGFAAAARKARRALADFVVEGVDTNIPFLRTLLGNADVVAGKAGTDFVDDNLSGLIDAQEAVNPARAPASEEATKPEQAAPKGTLAIEAPMAGVLASLDVEVGRQVAAGQEVALVEAMKMYHAVRAPCSGIVEAIAVERHGFLDRGSAIFFLKPLEADEALEEDVAEPIDLDAVRPDLEEVLDRKRGTLDEQRPDAVERRHASGRRTARENIHDLLDEDSFVEYGGLTIAGRSRRATTEELIAQSPADGLVMGLGTVNAATFGPSDGRIAVMSYDYTVFAGTQGARNHIKTDRLVELAERWNLPLVLFAEGGGGRPGDTDGGGFIRAFEIFPKLSGKVPMIGIVAGRCFAGNAALLGCCDVVIATKDTTLGMGGPAMIEGGGLGKYAPEEVGPVEVHVANGVVDIAVDDEAAAVSAAAQYLSYFQGPEPDWTCDDQRELRHAIPEDRLRSYDIRALLRTLADSGSVLELRRGFGLGMVTALARIEGRPVGVIANDPTHLGGAIDSDAADKAARFMQLCEAHRLPLVSLSDTPGIMVGPDVEKTALVRHAARMFLVGANLSVPILSVILRKSYGLGAIAMTGGSYQASLFSVAWPTGEFGGMGFEGAVKLGYRKELEAIDDREERQARFDELVAMMYQHGKALSTAGYFGIDDVIDPVDTRRWVAAALESAQKAEKPSGPAMPWIDSW